MGSNSGTLWAISATQKPIAPALSLTQTQHAPSLRPAAATCSPRTEDGGLCPAGAGGTGSELGQAQYGPCLIQPCAQFSPGALEPSAHPDTNLGMKKR